ncbi:MAG TPA: hypothetical protein DEB40_12780 [Elusimicrobia bacterium]|nr:hypothetical protein [Elusimicrobiota bacterium]HBT62609.1 hypothetical protein [Elusimicrobiota bacterium]
MRLSGGLSFREAWDGLDDASGRVAVAPLLPHLSRDFIVAAGRVDSLSASGQKQLARAFLAARGAAAKQVESKAALAGEALRGAIAAGTASQAEVEALSARLRGLSIYGASARASYEEARQAVSEAKVRRAREGILHTARNFSAPIPEEDPPGAEAAALARPGAWVEPGAGAGVVDGVPSPARTPGLSRDDSRYRKYSKAAMSAGYALLGVSAVMLFPAVPALAIAGIGQLHGILTWTGAALIGAGKYFQVPAQAVAAAAPVLKPAPATGWRGGLARWFASYRALWFKANESASAHRVFEARVGGASRKDFRNWLASGLRTTVLWIPIALAAMLGGHLLSKPVTHLWPAAVAAADPNTGIVFETIQSTSLLQFFNGYISGSVLQETVLLGVFFNGARWLAGRLGASERAAGLAGGLAVLAAYSAFLFFMGYPLAWMLPLLGIEAVMAMVYARTGTLLIPAGLRAVLSWATLSSARLNVGFYTAFSGSLVGLPALWSGLAVAGVSLAVFAAVAAVRFWATHRWGFLRAAWREQLSRLKELGQWWTNPSADGSPKSFLPLLMTGLLWGIVTYVAGDVTSSLVFLLSPHGEATPDILKRLLLMPVDVLMYNFIFVGLLEEWVFRRNVFKPIRERIAKWHLSSKALFWIAAVASSLIFSAAHYVDWNSMLAGLGIGDPELAKALAGTYAFTWPAFIARAAAGILLAFLYAHSGLLLVPIIAHFASNTMEGMGMKFGLPVFLAVAAAVVLAQLFSPKKLPESREAGKQ